MYKLYDPTEDNEFNKKIREKSSKQIKKYILSEINKNDKANKVQTNDNNNEASISNKSNNSAINEYLKK